MHCFPNHSYKHRNKHAVNVTSGICLSGDDCGGVPIRAAAIPGSFGGSNRGEQEPGLAAAVPPAPARPPGGPSPARPRAPPQTCGLSRPHALLRAGKEAGRARLGRDRATGRRVPRGLEGRAATELCGNEGLGGVDSPGEGARQGGRAAVAAPIGSGGCSSAPGPASFRGAPPRLVRPWPEGSGALPLAWPDLCPICSGELVVRAAVVGSGVHILSLCTQAPVTPKPELEMRLGRGEFGGSEEGSPRAASFRAVARRCPPGFEIDVSPRISVLGWSFWFVSLDSCNIISCKTEVGFHHIAQAGIKLLASSNPPALASQSAGITGSHHTQPDVFLNFRNT
ncbi:uncharacterized protein LOC144580765 [Callithrix jacchus]